MNDNSYSRSVRIDQDLGKLTGEDAHLDISALQSTIAAYRLKPTAIIHNNGAPIRIRGLLFCDNPPADIGTFTIVGNRPVALPFKHIYKDGTDWDGNNIKILGIPA